MGSLGYSNYVRGRVELEVMFNNRWVSGVN